MSNSLYEIIRGIIADQLHQLRTAELAVVKEVHCGSSECHACSVELRNSAIVLNKVPVATSKIGVSELPSVGDLVLVQFIDGDINAPIITGSLYNDEDTPPESSADKIVRHLPLTAKDDEAVHFELSVDGDKQVVLNVGKAAIVKLSEKDPAVTIQVNDGKGVITLESDGTIKIKNSGDFKIEGDGSIDIKSSANIKIEAGGNVEIKGTMIKLN